MKQLALVALMVVAGCAAAFGDPASILPPAVAGPPHICLNQKYYPPDAIRSCAQGTAYLSFFIAVDGSTKDISILQSTGNAELDEAAKICAADWQYKPATQDGQPVQVPWKASVRWALRGGRCTTLPVVPLANPSPPKP